ncbi:hypothetical protein GW17_00026518 [Ensete ventricosum]|nr:hypothetical protein GW17_00026518 [Ensete ventricosum]
MLPPLPAAYARGSHRHYERMPLLHVVTAAFTSRQSHGNRLYELLPAHGCCLSAASAYRQSLLPIHGLLLSRDRDVQLLPMHDRHSAWCCRNRPAIRTQPLCVVATSCTQPLALCSSTTNAAIVPNDAEQPLRTME